MWLRLANCGWGNMVWSEFKASLINVVKADTILASLCQLLWSQESKGHTLNTSVPRHTLITELKMKSKPRLCHIRCTSQ